jgi:pyruvate-formate lyase-activating enzyme
MAFTYPQLQRLAISLVGSGKIRDDLADFFHDLNVVSSVDELPQAANESVKPANIPPPQRAPGNGRLLVVCSFDREAWTPKLAARGLTYERDYIWAGDLIGTVDEMETFSLAQNSPGRRILVLGTGLAAELLMLHNPGLTIDYFIESRPAAGQGTFHGCPVKNFEALREERPGECVLVVAAMFSGLEEKAALMAKLRSLGWEFGRDFYFHEWELRHLRPVESLAKIKKFVIHGAGQKARDLLQAHPNLPAAYFLDNDPDKQGTIFEGRPVKAPVALAEEDPGSFVVLVASSAERAIGEQLAASGWRFGRDFMFYRPPDTLPYLFEAHPLLPPSAGLTKTVTASVAYKMHCDFETYACIVNVHGEVTMCCSHLGLLVGNVLTVGFWGLLESLAIKLFRLSLNNRTYSFCISRCPKYVPDFKYGPEERPERRRLAPPALKDILISLCYDPSCNLACKSCRQGRILRPQNERQAEMIHQEVLAALPFMGPLISTNGEIFFSRRLREIFLEKYETPRITIVTNGTLFNKANFAKLRSRYREIRVLFSVDGATAETYRHLRGGDFTRLMRNLRFAADRRKSGSLSYMTLEFVMQRDNFREMPAMVRLGRELGVDWVHFIQLSDWGSYGGVFAEMNVCDPSHPCHQEFLEVLRQPELSWPEVRCDFGDHGREWYRQLHLRSCLNLV